MAASRDRAASAHAHFGAASVQGILAHFQRQAGHAEQNICRAAGIRTGHEDDLFGPWNYLAGGDYSPFDGQKPGRIDPRRYFFSAGNEPFDVFATEENLADDCSD